MRRDEVLGMVYTKPPKRKDDLKKISGIAHLLENKLNAFGIYTYQQIMDQKKILLVHLPKGVIGEGAASLLGALIWVVV